MLRVISLFTLMSAANISASEVDNFSTINIPLEDSTKEMNNWMNTALDKALSDLSLGNKSCTKDYLFTNLVESMKLHKWAAFEYNLTGKKGIDRIAYLRDESIYKNAPFIASPVMTSGLGCCAPILKINNVRVGADKLGHFFSQGLSYYLNFDDKSLDHNKLERQGYGVVGGPEYNLKKLKEKKSAALFSSYEEDHWMGLYTNGVRSYADVAAGYDGYHFWKNFYGNADSLVKCSNGKFTRTRSFDWSHWVTNAWDESINCSEYDEKLKVVVQKNIAKLEKSLKRSLACPVTPDACADLMVRYLDVYPYALGPKCHNFSKLKWPKEELDSLLSPKNKCSL